MLAKDVPAEEQLLQALEQGPPSKVLRIVQELERQGGPISKPAFSPAVLGKWRLVWSAQVGAEGGSDFVGMEDRTSE